MLKHSEFEWWDYALQVYQVVVMRPCSIPSRQLAYNWRPPPNCRRHVRASKPTVCGSKTRRKQEEGRGNPGEGLREQESQESRILVEEQRSSTSQLSRSGKPIGWKVLPREDPAPIPDIQEVNVIAALPAQTPLSNCDSGQYLDQTAIQALCTLQEQTDDDELGPGTRGRVFVACATTSAILCALALALRARAPVMSPAALHTDPAAVERLLQCATYSPLQHA